MKSMNMVIESSVHDFYNIELDIESLSFEPATEAEQVADNVKDGTNLSKDNDLFKRMGDQISKFITMINGMIQKFFLKFSNWIKKVLQSDMGFKEQCRTAIKNNKPMEGIKLITYQYNEEALEKELHKLNDILTSFLNQMNRNTSYRALSDESTASDIDRTPDEIYDKIFSKLSCPGDVRDINSYFLYVKKLYRGEKKEQVFVSSNTRQYYQVTEGNKELTNQIKKSEAIMKNQISVLKSNLHNTIQNKDANKEVKKRAMNQCKNLTHIYNLYLHFLDIYFQLKIERIYIYRTILKKIYRF